MDGAASITPSAVDESTPKLCAEAARPLSARWKRNDHACLRRGRERVGSLPPRVHSPLLKASTTILLATRLGSRSWRAGPSSSSHRAQFRWRELGCPHGPRARSPCAGRQRGGCSEQLKAFVRLAYEEEEEQQGATPLFVFDAFSTISCEAPAGAQGMCPCQILLRLRASLLR